MFSDFQLFRHFVQGPGSGFGPRYITTFIHGIGFCEFPLATSGHTLTCDISTGKLQPYIPAHLSHAVFQQLHGFSHPGVHSTKQLITTRFLWPRINAGIVRWTSACVPCQRFKISRHTSPPLFPYNTPTGRFHNVYVDIVGPFPRSRGHWHVLAVVGR